MPLKVKTAICLGWIAAYVFYVQHMMSCGEYAVTIKR
jgi:hypothetical protein